MKAGFDVMATPLTIAANVLSWGMLYVFQAMSGAHIFPFHNQGMPISYILNSQVVRILIF
jgi:hypothetical protein